MDLGEVGEVVEVKGTWDRLGVLRTKRSSARVKYAGRAQDRKCWRVMENNTSMGLTGGRQHHSQGNMQLGSHVIQRFLRLFVHGRT